MLDVLAIIAAGADVVLALFVAWGLSQQADSGRRGAGVLALTLVASSVATVFAVHRVVRDDAVGWVVVAALPPLVVLVGLVSDRDLLWGNFAPPAGQRALQRILAVAVFALPGLLAWVANPPT